MIHRIHRLYGYEVNVTINCITHIPIHRLEAKNNNIIVKYVDDSHALVFT